MACFDHFISRFQNPIEWTNANDWKAFEWASNDIISPERKSFHCRTP